MKMPHSRYTRNTVADADGDPLEGMVNLFDVAMVFSVALMVAVVTNMRMAEMFTQEDFTIVKNPGKDEMEIIVKKGQAIEQYKATGENSGAGKGKRVGTAYQLDSGEIIYVPE